MKKVTVLILFLTLLIKLSSCGDQNTELMFQETLFSTPLSCFSFAAGNTKAIVRYNTTDDQGKPCPKDIITIPDGTISINDNALSNYGLISVMIPGSVAFIGRGAFSNNNLISVEIAEGVASIGDRAFADNNLTKVTIPGSVRHIGRNAFQNNNTLMAVCILAERAFINISLGAFPSSVTPVFSPNCSN